MKAGGIIMKKNQLPKQVLNTLLAYQIKSDDILDVCPFDLSFDSEYISGYLFLTSTNICTILGLKSTEYRINSPIVL